MAEIKVTVDDKAFQKQLQSIKDYVSEGLVKEMVDEYRQQTPIDTGNARRKTIRKRNSVVGNYGYAGVLDQGLFPNPPKEGTGKTSGGYSTQATRGMAEPTIEHVEKELDKFIKRSNR